MQVHDVVNVNLLKPYVHKEGEMKHIAPPALLPDGSVQDEVECIIEHQGEGKNRQFLLKWSDNAMPTWHVEADLRNCRKLVKEYFARLKQAIPSGRQQAPQQDQSLEKSKASVHPAAVEPAHPVRRSARLRKLVQSVLQLFRPKKI